MRFAEPLAADDVFVVVEIFVEIFVVASPLATGAATERFSSFPDDADALLPRPPASSLGSRDAASALSAGPETRCALTACRSSLASASISLFFFASALSSRRSRSLHFATASLMLSTVTESSPFAMRRIMLRPSFMCRFTTQDSVGGRAGCHDGVRPE